MKYVYVLELYTRAGLQTFGAYSTETHARRALRTIGFSCGAIITRLLVNCDYASGVGAAKHWHIENKGVIHSEE